MAEAPPRLQHFLYPNSLRPKLLDDTNGQIRRELVRNHLGSTINEVLARLAYVLGDDLSGGFPIFKDVDLERVAQQEDQRIHAQLQTTLDFVGSGGTRLPNDPNGIMTASFLLAIRAHDGEMRKNDHPYVHHPMAVAALSSILLEGHSGRRRGTAVGFVHDTFEHALERHADTIGQDVLYSSGSGDEESVIVTPRMMHALFDRLRRSDGSIASKELLLLTKNHGIDGTKVERANYDERILRSLGASAIKFADRFHNGIDSVPHNLATQPKHIRTVREYKAANAITREAYPSLNYVAAANAAHLLDMAWQVYDEFLSQPDVAHYLDMHDASIEIGSPPYDKDYAESAA